MRYDPSLKYVLVGHLGNINLFIMNQRELFSEEETMWIVDRLIDHVTI